MMLETRSQATISRILDVARTLFLTKSYADVSMASLAAGADVTKGALYHHFVGKEELYLALLHRDLKSKGQLFRQSVEASGTARQRLARLTRDFLTLPREERALIRLVRRDINIFHDPVRANLISAYQEALPNCVASIISDGIRAGELRPQDTRLASWHFVGMVEVTLTPYANGVLGDVTAKLDHVLDLFFSGSAASPTTS